MSLNSETISELVAVVLMIAPSASDNHVENFSRPALTFDTHADCHVARHSFNEMEVPVQLIPGGPITIAYAWCNPIYEGEDT